MNCNGGILKCVILSLSILIMSFVYICRKEHTHEYLPHIRLPSKYTVINASPRIVKVPEFLNLDEISHLLSSDSSFEPSTVVDGKKDGSRNTHDSRTSETAHLDMNHPGVAAVAAKIATLANLPVENLEPLQLTRYKKNKEYKPHYDWLDDKSVFNKYKRGQRVRTVFVYLRGLETQGGEKCGGATAFVNAQKSVLRVFPVTGTAVVWDNVIRYGKEDHQTLHAGEPPVCDNIEKIGLNAWFRDKKYA